MKALEKYADRKAAAERKIFCLLLGAALASAPLAMARDHQAPQQTSSQSQQRAPEPAVPSLEYVRVKMGKSIFLDPPEDEEPSVYVRIRDTSGNGFNLQRQVIGLLAENGFSRARSLKKASYVLQANLLFAEEVSEAQLHQINESDYDQGVGDILSAAVVGGAVGGAADSVIGDHSGLGAGSIIGGILGIAVAAQEGAEKKRQLAEKKATKYFSAVVDIEVRQRAEGDVIRRGRSNINQETEQGSSQGSLTGNDSFSESDQAETQEVDEYTVKSKWVRYRARVVASAKGRHVTLDDVKEPILRKLSSALGGMF